MQTLFLNATERVCFKFPCTQEAAAKRHKTKYILITESLNFNTNLWFDEINRRTKWLVNRHSSTNNENTTVVFRNESERYSFRFRKQKKPQLITALRGVGPLESQTTKKLLARFIILRGEIDLRVVTIRKTKGCKLYFGTQPNASVSSFRTRKKPRRNATRQDAFSYRILYLH